MDMLIALHGMAPQPPCGMAGPTIRKPIGPEHDLAVAWVADRFSASWASEVRAALSNRPISLFLALHGEPRELLGFCCYDATARGFVGPIGVAASARGQGVGAALLRAALTDMRAQGYAYAIAGAVGAPDFFRRVAGAIDIPGSTPGIYADMLRAAPPAP